MKLFATTIALILGLLSSATEATTDINAPVEFHIDVGNAEETLNEFAIQSHLQLLFDFESLHDVPTRAVKGRLKPLEALARLLEGTDVQFAITENQTLRITRVTSSSDNAGPDDADPMAEVVISSTRLPTTLAEEASLANSLGLSNSDIEAGEFVTVQATLATLPQIFGGGPTEDTSEVGTEARTNVAKGAGINLRGVGAGSTLVLVNGWRPAPSGSEGLFVDVSSIPLAAVERIEILSDSNSIFHGADSVGGVVNFVMRDRFDGCETVTRYGASTRSRMNENYLSNICGQVGETTHGALALEFFSRDNLPAKDRRLARSNLTPFGGSNFDLLQANPGNIFLAGRTWAVPRGQDGRSLRPADFVEGTQNTQNRYEGADLLPSQQRLSVFATAASRLTGAVSVFVDGLLGTRQARSRGVGQSAMLSVPETNPFYVNPTGGRGLVTVAYNFVEDLGPLISTSEVGQADVAGGVHVNLRGSWRVTAKTSYAFERLRTEVTNVVDQGVLNASLRSSDRSSAFNPFGDGSHTNPAVLEAMRAEAAFSTESRLLS